MNNTFKALNQLYYLMYTMIILLAITSYFLNINHLLDFEIPKPYDTVLLSIQSLICFIAVVYYAYFLIIAPKFKSSIDKDKREIHYLNTAKIRLFLIGISLIVGVVCLYLVRSEIVLYLIAVSGVLLFLSKPNEAKINSFLSE